MKLFLLLSFHSPLLTTSGRRCDDSKELLVAILCRVPLVPKILFCSVVVGLCPASPPPPPYSPTPHSCQLLMVELLWGKTPSDEMKHHPKKKKKRKKNPSCISLHCFMLLWNKMVLTLSWWQGWEIAFVFYILFYSIFLCFQYFIGVTMLSLVAELPEVVNGIQFALQNNVNLG